MSAKTITRQGFLKTGCLSVTAAGLTICGVSPLIPNPDPASIDLPTSTYGVRTMNKRILVAYASALGSTDDVAAEIGKTLSANGISVDVKPIQGHLQTAGYQAVLIGSAVQYGNWLPEAVEYVQANRKALNELPVALFTVHISNLGNDENNRWNRLAFLDAVRPLLDPVDEVFFAGKFDRRGAALLMPGWLARFVPPIDMEKWVKIRAWAEGLRPELLLQA